MQRHNIPSPRLFTKLTSGLLALCLALASSLVAHQPVQARYLSWPEDGPGIFGPNEAVYIEIGAITYTRDCPENGIKDFLIPFADIYVVRGDVKLGQTLHDITGQPNTVMGTTLSGAFASQLIGTTKPGGKLGAGTYTIVYDECQDKVLGPEDSVFGNALQVIITADAPPLPDYLDKVKDNALKQAKRLLEARGWMDYVSSVANASSLLSLSDMVYAVMVMIASKATGVDPIREGLVAMDNGIRHYLSIADDPPDPNFQQLTTLPPVTYDVVASSDPVEQAVAANGFLAAEEAAMAEALLHALERYQGADQEGNGDWALVQARAVRQYALLLADHLLLMQAGVDSLNSAVGAHTEDFDATEVENWRMNVVDNGFAAEDLQTLRNLNLLSRDIVELRSELAETPFESNAVSKAEQSLAGLKEAQAELRSSMLELAAQMEPVIATLVSLPEVVDTQPTAEAGGPYTAIVSQTVTLDGSASQAAEGRTLDYAWDLNGDGLFDDATGAKPEVTFERAFSGYVGLLVTDNSGRQSVDYARIAVTGGNRPPQITNPVPADGAEVVQLGHNNSVNFQADVTDPDGDPVEYAWLLDGMLVGSLSTYTFAPGPGSLGIHRVQLVVNDGKPNGVNLHSWWVIGLYYDVDGDGWHANADCSDGDAAIHPGMNEVVGNGIDDDCNPRTTDSGLVLPPDLFEVTKFEDTNDGICDEDCSLREAVLAANQSPEQILTITLPAGVYSLSIQGTAEGEGATGDLDLKPVVGQTFILTGQGADTTILDAEDLGDRVLDIHSGAVVVQNLTIRNAHNPHVGGYESVGGAIAVLPALDNAGAIWDWDYVAPAVLPPPTELTVVDSVLTNNTTSNGGGIGVHTGSAKVTVIRSHITQNRAIGLGGGIVSFGLGQTITLIDSEVSENVAACNGGGIHLQNGCYGAFPDQLVLENTRVEGNSVFGTIDDQSLCAFGQGGGISLEGTLIARNSSISHNRAQNAGGGIYNHGSCQPSPEFFQLIDSEVSHNVVISDAGSAGGIHSQWYPVMAERSIISHNQADFVASIFGPVYLTNTVVSHNEAEQVGGLRLENYPSVIVNSTIHDNGDHGLYADTENEVILKNTIIANHEDGNCVVVSGATIHSLGYNLSDDDTCGLTATGDISNTNPLLAVEMVDGVEQTTHALTPQSPAIDGANAHTCPPDDVHGTARPQAADCDIGAYEYDPFSLLRFTKARYRVPAATSEVTLTVERSGDTVGEVTVAYATEDMTALAGTDYTAASGQITFAAGETMQQITIALHGTKPDAERTFMVTLSEPTGGALLTAINQAAVTIEMEESEIEESDIYIPYIAN